jgi:hypothetical protein
MTFRSQTQPFCRCCGKPIAKSTTTHHVGKTFKFENGQRELSWDDVQKLTNEQVVSVKYHYESERYETKGDDIYDRNIKRITSGRRTVYLYTTWDGESYVDQFFCTGECAKALGYGAAREGWATGKWRARAR